MNVFRTFHSIQGEGRFSGYPSSFLRLYGCNLKCSYCDTLESVNLGVYKTVKVSDVINEVLRYPEYDICITGGEPVMQKDELIELIKGIAGKKRITIETNGSYSLMEFKDRFENLFFSVDWKTPFSGNSNFCEENLEIINNNNGWIKFVVGNEHDLDFVQEKISLLKEKNIEIYISPVYNKSFNILPAAASFVMKNSALYPMRIQLQIHRFMGVE